VEGARAGAEAPEAGRPGAGAGPPEAGPPEKGRPGAASPGAGLLERRGELERQLGIRLQPTEDGAVEIVAMPEELLALEEEELVEAILWERGSVEELQARVLSLAACRLAVKEGEELDAGAAESLVRGVFALDNARCPHGRPIWTELSREDLERAVGRE
jgi:DNA mismatch repair protein MutL